MLFHSAWAGSTLLQLDSESGLPTPNETKSLIDFVATVTPAAENADNAWVYGKSGQLIEALGLAFEATHDRRLLDSMIRFCDVALSERNDLAAAPIGHRTLWTGMVEPIWPTQGAGTLNGGSENGDVIGHIAYCGKLILDTPAIAQAPVPDGDPNHFGVTYLERAKKYVRMLDQSVDSFIIPQLVRIDLHSRFYFPDTEAFRNLGLGNAGAPVPWNQQMWIDNGLERLAECHILLKDDVNRVQNYHRLIRESLRFFLSDIVTIPNPRRPGSVYLRWYYAFHRTNHIEDSNHADGDLQGLFRLYLSGHYPDLLTKTIMQEISDGQVDVMSLGDGTWAGKIDGHNGPVRNPHEQPTAYPRSNFFFALLFRPEAYSYYVNSSRSVLKNNPPIFSKILWLKAQRAGALGKK